MIPHEVVRIIGEPVSMEWKMDHVTLAYWGVPVILKQEREQHESIVTFESYEEANKLRVGDVFLR